MKTFTKTLFAGIAASAMTPVLRRPRLWQWITRVRRSRSSFLTARRHYDKYGVAFSNHLGNHIPGNPNIILQHMPGAGGAKAMNWFANVAPKDGLTLIVPLDNGVTNQLMRPEKMRYDARKFTWLGSSNQTNVVMVVRTSGVTKLEDLKTKAIIGSTSGKNSSGYINPMLIRGLFDYKIKMVTGYQGSSKSIFASSRVSPRWPRFNWLAWSSMPHWFTGDKPFAKAVAQIGIFRDPDLPKSVPMINELVTDEMDKKAVGFLSVAGLLGRGLALPPGVDKDVVHPARGV